jgi:hypothetical protein
MELRNCRLIAWAIFAPLSDQSQKPTENSFLPSGSILWFPRDQKETLRTQIARTNADCAPLIINLSDPQDGARN